MDAILGASRVRWIDPESSAAVGLTDKALGKFLSVTTACLSVSNKRDRR